MTSRYADDQHLTTLRTEPSFLVMSLGHHLHSASPNPIGPVGVAATNGISGATSCSLPPAGLSLKQVTMTEKLGIEGTAEGGEGPRNDSATGASYTRPVWTTLRSRFRPIKPARPRRPRRPHCSKPRLSRSVEVL